MLPTDDVHTIRDEIKWLSNHDRMSLNHTHLVTKGETKLLPKQSIMECEMALEARDPTHVPYLSSMFTDTSLLQSVHTHCNDLFPVDRQMIKVQKNLGSGGCFPFHFDTNGKDGRVFTAILYLNESWQRENGGELFLYPFPHRPKRIDPILNRLVIFSSLDMLHSVAPSSVERYCLTIWLYGNSPTVSHFPPPFGTVTEETEPWKHAISFLCHHTMRRHFAKWFYRYEWAESIMRSHPDTNDTKQAINNHWNDVAIIETALSRILAKNNFSFTLQQLQELLNNHIAEQHR